MGSKAQKQRMAAARRRLRRQRQKAARSAPYYREGEMPNDDGPPANFSCQVEEDTYFAYDAVEEVADHLAQQAYEFMNEDLDQSAHILVLAALRSFLATSDEATISDAVEAVHAAAEELHTFVDEEGNIIPDGGEEPPAAGGLDVGEAP